MQCLLDNLSALEAVLHNRPLGLITDIDGTLTPTSRDILHVTIPEATRKLLEELSHKLDVVVVISGRGAAEVRSLVDGEKIVCIGHYGMERWQDNAAVIDPRVRPYIDDMRAVAREIEPLRADKGIIVQDKYLTISLHYRISPHPDETRKKILALLDKSSHAKNIAILEEKMVVGIMPPVHISKGTAITDLIAHHDLRGAIYLGDDVADTLAFRAIREAGANPDFRGLGIGVANEETPPEVLEQADYVVEGVGETQKLLEWIAEVSRLK